jgi:hypothetical protein
MRVDSWEVNREYSPQLPEGATVAFQERDYLPREVRVVRGLRDPFAAPKHWIAALVGMDMGHLTTETACRTRDGVVEGVIDRLVPNALPQHQSTMDCLLPMVSRLSHGINYKRLTPDY